MANALDLHSGRLGSSPTVSTLKKREIKIWALFSLTMIDVISAVKIYHVQGHNKIPGIDLEASLNCGSQS